MSNKRGILLCYWFWCWPAAAWAQDGYLRQPGFDVLHYDLGVAVSDSGSRIRGEAAIKFVLREGDHSALRLDLKHMEVSRLALAQQGLAFQYDGNAITVAVPPQYKTGDTLHVQIDYAGAPQDGLIIRNNKFGRRGIFADNWPNRASFWFPAIDHPSDKAAVDFHISAPEHFTVVANGKLLKVEAPDASERIWHWRERAPIPTYCMVFGAADFTTGVFDVEAALPVSYYVFPENAAAARQDFGRVPAMMEFFTQKIGAFPYEKLALVQSATRFGGMENAGAIFFAENSIGAARSIEGTAAHEIAHQWFGDAVTPANWRHLWLSEGFATYGEALFYEHAEGVEKFREKMAARRETYLQFAQQKPGPILAATTTDYVQLLNANNYSKGAWVLHMLRQVVGEEEFWRGLRAYYTRFRHGNATTEDFRAVMEEASGDSLAWFFQQWLEQPGYPHVEVAWQWLPERAGVEIVLRQTQAEYFYRLPVEIAWQAGREQGLARIEMKQREHQAFFATPRPPQHLTVDPHVKALLTFVLAH